MTWTKKNWFLAQRFLWSFSCFVVVFRFFPTASAWTYLNAIAKNYFSPGLLVGVGGVSLWVVTGAGKQVNSVLEGNCFVFAKVKIMGLFSGTMRFFDKVLMKIFQVLSSLVFELMLQVNKNQEYLSSGFSGIVRDFQILNLARRKRSRFENRETPLWFFSSVRLTEDFFWQFIFYT